MRASSPVNGCPPSNIYLQKEKAKSSGWASFIIASIIFILGHWVFTGTLPGISGATKWWSILILFLLWGAVSAAMEAISNRKKK